MANSRPREFCAEEKAAIKFFDDHRGGTASASVRELEDLYNETVCDAGRYWMHCEFTCARLESIQNDLDDMVEYWVERIRDWASD